jgi:hypothetical protein
MTTSNFLIIPFVQNYLNKLLRDPYDISHYGIKPDDTVFLLRRFTSGNGYGSENGGPRALQNLGNTCYMNRLLSATHCF